MSDVLLALHQKWINYLQPEGLVVSAQTLVDQQVGLPQNLASLQSDLREFLDDSNGLVDLGGFLTRFLGWPGKFLKTGSDIPESLIVPLDAFGDELRPTWALEIPSKIPEVERRECPWILVREESAGTDLDRTGVGSGWQASPQARLERLLRDTGCSVGLLTNGAQLRLVVTPRGESAGSLTFPVTSLGSVAGRPMLGALRLLLGQDRILAAGPKSRLWPLLRASRNAQASVSAQLSQQVLESLYELLRGFAQADRQHPEHPLAELVKTQPQEVYQGLLTVLLRLVFLLYAEDRGVLPQTDLYQSGYSVHGLWEQLRQDADRFPDTMDQRFGAWSRLLAVFSLVHRGCAHDALKLPPRQGHLFDPDRFPFLGDADSVPLVPDGTLYRVLKNLLVLHGERLSYRTLDVEQIGSVYEAIMGFSLVTVSGTSVAVRPAKTHGAPPVLDLEQLLAMAPAKRKELFERETLHKVGKFDGPLKEARTVGALLDALRPLQDVRATPHPVPPGGWILVPSEERRKSGSHYTPRSLTGPVVRKALEPLFLQMGDRPTPEQILDLKVCDPAMGSGAFLVEVCRQLADRLVESWKMHQCLPTIPPDEDELLYARRIVAQRCLYGVDRNPMAVDLAKLSLWLATLAQDHPFTFLDHSLRAGDSLVGLSRAQAVAFHWDPSLDVAFGSHELDEKLVKAQAFRLRILEGGDLLAPAHKSAQLQHADIALQVVREAADLVVGAFFGAEKPKAREAARSDVKNNWGFARKDLSLLLKLSQRAADLRTGEHALAPFHWEMEFPEVFFPGLAKGDRTLRGFDCLVGNPPFAGKNTIAQGNHPQYLDWLKALHEQSHGNADLSAHFFRRCFDLVREGGAYGLIATNTIAQGDTRSTGLRYIRQNDGIIYHAKRRVKWPGEAAVVVSVVHVLKSSDTTLVEPVETRGVPGSQVLTGSTSEPGASSGTMPTKGPRALPILLDDREVEKITAFLFHDGGDENPATLKRNADKSFIGSYVLGMGFTFDDTNPEATSLAEMHRLIAKDPRNQERIFPYIGGEEVNDSPTHAHHRYVINFGEMPLRREELGVRWAECSEEQAKLILRTGIVPLDYPGEVAGDWPDLLSIVEEKVKGVRGSHSTAQWWHFERLRGELFAACEGKSRVLVACQTSRTQAFSLVPPNQVFSHKLIVFPFGVLGFFAVLQSSIHLAFSAFMGSSMKDDLVYTPSDCFETFPFPAIWESNPVLERVGREYHDFRAALMVRHNEGLTKTYNRFHDPAHDGSGIDGLDPAQVVRDIDELRRLHSELDLAVLAAYGWTDLDPTLVPLLDYEDEEDEDAPKRGKGRKKPWRLRFPDPVRDEILARLLALNARYAEEERREAELEQPRTFAAKPRSKAKALAEAPAPKAPRSAKPSNPDQGSLL